MYLIKLYLYRSTIPKSGDSPSGTVMSTKSGMPTEPSSQMVSAVNTNPTRDHWMPGERETWHNFPLDAWRKRKMT